MATEPETGASPLRRRGTKTATPRTPPDDATPAIEPSAPPRRLNRRYLAILIVGALGAGLIVGIAAAFATRHTTPTFQSQALLEIDQPHAVAVSVDDGVIAKLSRLRFKYAGLLRTQTMAVPVAQKTNLPLGEVANAIFVAVDPDTLVLSVGARTHNRDDTQKIAAATAQELIDYTRHEQASLKVPATSQLTWTLVTPATPAVKISPTQQRSVLVGLGAFVFVTGGALAFGYLWRRDY